MQRVKLDDVRSSWKYILVCGVLQGSQAGCGIFYIFLNDRLYFLKGFICQTTN